MKKTFTRALSLILVLVAILGVMPTAFAKEAKDGATVTLNSTSVNMEVGSKHQIEVESMISSYDIVKVYFPDSGLAASLVLLSCSY